MRLLFIILALFAQPLFAQDITGTITGNVGEETGEWSTIQIEDINTANTSEVVPTLWSFSIQGHRDAKFATEGTVSIEFDIVNETTLMSADVTYFYGSSIMENYQSDDSVTLTLTQIEKVGDTYLVAGNIVGEIYKSSGKYGEEIDADDAMPVDLTFTATAENRVY